MQGGERAGPAKTSLSEWQDGLTRAVGDAKWHAWDCEIQAAVNEYNRHLSATAGYLSLDWRTIKAVAWIETGANHPQWRIKPLQIGVQGDPGLRSLLSGNEGGDLIIPPIWKSRLTMSSATTMPSHNIRAGIGYLLMRMANYEYRSVLDRDAKVYEVKVAPGDTMDKIARRNGSATAVLKTLNPASNQEFARYRTAQCAFSMSLIGGGAGNSREIGRLRCVAALNYHRASQLRDAVADLPFK